MKQKRNIATGFTLVELLIAIVVIAILAAATVVGYTNLQQRAYATDLLARTDAFEKALIVYHTEHGRFPSYGDVWGTCLGRMSDYPAENGYQEGECMRWVRNGQPDGSEYVNENILNQLSTVISPMPSGKIRESREEYTYSGTLYQRFQRGIYYEHQNNSPGSSVRDWAYIEYMYDGVGACPKDFAERYNEDTNSSFCSRIVWANDTGID